MVAGRSIVAHRGERHNGRLRTSGRCLICDDCKSISNFDGLLIAITPVGLTGKLFETFGSRSPFSAKSKRDRLIGTVPMRGQLCEELIRRSACDG
jgi:hypothetical protein